jgi:hypothetical protein
MKKLGAWAALAAAVPALALVAAGCASVDLSDVRPYLYLWIGCMVGVWLSFGARNVSVNFEELGVIEKDRLSPPVRLVFAGLLTLIIGLLISSEAVLVELGELSTANFTEDPKFALLIGALCGISELALSAKVSQRASELVSKT